MGLMDALEGVGYVVDTPRALTHGLVAKLGDALQGRPVRDNWRASGREMLESLGVLGPNQEGLDAGDVLGFGAEMALDPLNLLGGAGILSRLRGAQKARALNAKSLAQRASGFMPEEVAKMTKVVDETGLPKKMFHGTAVPFDRYDLSRADVSSLYGPGVYMTDSPSIASEYVGKSVDELTPAIKSRVNDNIENLENRIKRIQKMKAKLIRGVRERAGLTADAMDSELGRVMTNAELSKRGQAEYLSRMARGRIEEMKNRALYESLSPNVKMHYVDIRNPFDMERRSMTGSEAADLIEKSGLVRGDMSSTPAPMSFGGVDEYENLADAVSSIRKMDEFMPPSAGRGTPAEKIYATLDELGGSKRIANEALQRMGYDGITYPGGRIIGNVPHKVAVAFSPDQIYKPYVASELKSIPNARSMLASLLGYNVARNMDQ